ncbi:hypothetical protein ACFLQW_03100 [Candidatus Zixiibacteriota bacterium]
MADFIPPGRLSGYKHAGKTIQVQTEYATRPHPRVTTSVVLDGRTIHKTDHPWDQGVDTEDAQKNLEEYLAEQHRKTLGLVEARAHEYVGDSLDKKSTTEHPEPSFRDSMCEILSSLPFITAMCEFDQSGKIVFSRDFCNIHADLGREFQIFAKLVYSLPEIIRVGGFRHGCCWFPAENVILVHLRERLFGIITEPCGSVERIRDEFPELFEATYD